MKKYSIVLLLLAFSVCGYSQGMAFGFKAGPSVGFQKWNTGAQRDALFAYHGIVFIESLAGKEESFAIFAQAGYHVRGGAVRLNRFTYVNQITGQLQDFGGRTDRYEFRNASLSLGGKQKFNTGNLTYYYLLGIRGDFTINTNLNTYVERYNGIGSFYFPTDNNVRRLNYGAIVGGGFEFPLTEYMAGIIEVTVNPDFSKQYRSFAIDNVYNPYTMNNQTIPGQEFSNLTLEVSVGLRFIREVEYID